MPSSYAYHREVENTYLVRDRDRQLRRDLVRVCLWVLPITAAVLGYVWLQVQVLNSSYTIVDLEHELTAADRQRARLSLELAQRTGLPRVEARAREELGMVVPKAESTLFWSELSGGTGSATTAPRNTASRNTASRNTAPSNTRPDNTAPGVATPQLLDPAAAGAALPASSRPSPLPFRPTLAADAGEAR